MGRTEVKAEQEDLSVWQRRGNERSAQDCRTLNNIEKHKQKTKITKKNKERNEKTKTNQNTNNS